MLLGDKGVVTQITNTKRALIGAFVLLGAAFFMYEAEAPISAVDEVQKPPSEIAASRPMEPPPEKEPPVPAVSGQAVLPAPDKRYLPQGQRPPDEGGASG